METDASPCMSPVLPGWRSGNIGSTFLPQLEHHSEGEAWAWLATSSPDSRSGFSVLAGSSSA